jgi:hypothetical protein
VEFVYKTRNPAIILKYKKLSNNIQEKTHNLQKKNKVKLHISVKPIQKTFGIIPIANSKKLRNLNFINSLGKEEITSNDTTKTEVLNPFFSSVFAKEENTNFILL